MFYLPYNYNLIVFYFWFSFCHANISIESLPYMVSHSLDISYSYWFIAVCKHPSAFPLFQNILAELVESFTCPISISSILELSYQHTVYLSKCLLLITLDHHHPRKIKNRTNSLRLMYLHNQKSFPYSMYLLSRIMKRPSNQDLLTYLLHNFEWSKNNIKIFFAQRLRAEIFLILKIILFYLLNSEGLYLTTILHGDVWYRCWRSSLQGVLLFSFLINE